MSKTIKNLTALAVVINDTGITIPASGQYVIPEFDYLLWAQSSDFIVEVDADKLIVNNGLFDLTKEETIYFIKYPDFATSQIFLNNTYRSNGFTSRLTQMAIEEGRSKAGTIPAISFSGNPKTAIVVFVNAYADNNYAVAIDGDDKRSWSVDGRTASGFTLNANANKPLTGNVYWTTTHNFG